MNRREMLIGTGAAAAGLAGFPFGWPAGAQAEKRRILFFTKSSGFQHSAITRKGEELSHAERVLTEIGAKHGLEVTCSKDGRLFTPENLAKYDAVAFYTTGDLTQEGTDKQPPMTAAGKEALLAAIRSGKGFVGTHSATDTFHTAGGDRWENDAAPDPFIAMIGGEFIGHGPQQKARMTAVDNRFPGCEGLGGGFEINDEWYSLKNIAPDMHVLLVQGTEGMDGRDYQRPPYPATWARRHGRGRVFYTSMGHREDVWTNPTFQKIFLGGIAWATAAAEAEVKPNLTAVTPRAAVLPPRR